MLKKAHRTRNDAVNSDQHKMSLHRQSALDGALNPAAQQGITVCFLTFIFRFWELALQHNLLTSRDKNPSRFEFTVISNFWNW